MKSSSVFYLLFACCFFQINYVNATNYYWIGGTGSWSDINHWATTSGGTVNHLQVPTPFDDVFFDANSFTGANHVVTINAVNAVCHDMNWTGALYSPKCSGNNTLRIYGSLTLIQAMTWNMSGSLYFEATSPGKTIITAGKSIWYVYFQGIGGGWTLMDDLNLTYGFYHTAGTFSTNNKNISCRSFASSYSNSVTRSLTLGSSVITCTDPFNYQLFYIYSDYLNLDAGTSTIKISGNASNNNYVDRITIYGYTPITFNNIEISNTNDNTLSGYMPYWDIRPKTTIRKFTITGNDFWLKNISSNARVIIDSLIIKGNGEKIFDNSYRLKINEIICSENPVLVLNSDNQDTITNIRFTGKRCTLNGSSSKFRTVSLNGDSYINGSNTFDSLKFFPGFLYEIASTNTQTVVYDLSAQGICSGSIIFRASIPGLQGEIKKPSGTVTTNYLILRDISATGLSFVANNSVDGGNNSGWTINQPTPRNLFWVGGSGNWTDIAHWSISSGGSGGACIPTSADHVNFDANSFSSATQLITVNTGHALCNNMTWNGVAATNSIKGDTTRIIHIFGSLALSANMSWDFLGRVFFESSSTGKTITTGGKLFLHHTVFRHPGGGWTLLDGFSTSKNLVYEYGSLNTNGQAILCKTFSSDNENMRSLTLGNSVLTCNSPIDDYNFLLNSTNFNLNAGTSTVKLSGANTNSYPVSMKGANPLIFYNFENSNTSNCTPAGFSCWDIRANLTMHKLTVGGKQFRLIKNSTANNVKVSMDSLLIKGDCDKMFDTIYRLKITNMLCSESPTVTLHADQNDTIYNIFHNGLLLNIDGDQACFHKAMLYGNSNIYGLNRFDSLIFAPGFLYQLGSAKTQTVVDYLGAVGTCAGNIFIKATNTGTQANLVKAGGDVTVNYGILQDLNASGGAVFNATNSIDMGNNSGWNITAPNPLSLFWVGGSGNWGDPQHWALTSGGNGGSCIPSPLDDVTFDQLSFSAADQIVNANSINAFCHDMTWTGVTWSPKIKGVETNSLRIYGSLQLIPKMSWNFSGTVWFMTPEAGKTITTSGQSFLSDVYFQGSYNAAWTLSDSLKTSGDIRFNYGNLNTNSKNVYCRAFYSDYPNPRTLTLGNSTLTCNSPSSSIEPMRLNSDNLNLNAGTSTVRILGYTSENNPILFTGSGSLKFYNFNINSNYYSSAYWSTWPALAIRKLQVESGYIYFWNKNAQNDLKIKMDSVVLSQGTLYLDHYYLSRFNFKINSLVSKPGSRLYVYGLDQSDSICNITSNGNHLEIYGSGTKFHNVRIAGDANINGNNSFDSLTFAAGRIYQLGYDYTQTINQHFSALGNGCFPITIKSTYTGRQSVISKNSGTVLCGYLEMRDQKASGGASFYAGKYSSNVSNNSGWIFANGPGYIYGLGPDTSFCQGDTLHIGTQYFYGGISWLWQDGSNKPYYKATQPGLYWVKVTYSNDCFFIDSIQVSMKLKPVAIASSNSPVCSGDTLHLYGIGGTLYSWNGPDSFTSNLKNPIIVNTSVANSGNYLLQVVQNGCTSALDTVSVGIIQSISSSVSVKASANQVCEGTQVTFTPAYEGGGQSPQFHWYVNTLLVHEGNFYTYVPTDHDKIFAVMVSSLECVIGDSAISNTITMNVDPYVPAGVSILTSSNPICEVTPVTFTATILNGGSNPACQWYKDNLPFAIGASFTYIPVDGDQVYAVMTSSLSCVTENPATSSIVIMDVVPYEQTGLTAFVSQNPVCEGTSVTYNAISSGGGSAPFYQWFINKTAIATGPSFINVPMHGDTVYVVMTSSLMCPLVNPVVSDSIIMTVNPNLPVNITISTASSTVCEGTTVAFTASGINTGNAPLYLWQVNGFSAGANIPVFSYTPSNNDLVQCILNSNAICPVGSPAASNIIKMTVNPNLPVSITISTASSTVCEGTAVAFTASGINTGNAPLYQWLVNGLTSGANNPVFSYTPSNNDLVQCILSSNAVCPVGSPATSNVIKMTVNPHLPVSITVSTTSPTVCEGTVVTFIASGINTGNAPQYQWQVNGLTSGANDPVFSYTPSNNDLVQCILSSNVICSVGNPALSNPLIITVWDNPVTSLTLCPTVTARDAIPFPLKGGIPFGGVYSGVGVQGSNFNPASVPSNQSSTTISYGYTNVHGCSDQSSQTVFILTGSSGFQCGQPFTDVRDNQVYQTIQIGTQCWMRQNLNYGIVISSSQMQTDNCIPEKYCFINDVNNCSLFGGLYQWNELMEYRESEPNQGLCPPGWQIPSETDWDLLINILNGPGLAGDSLKPGGISGFESSLVGLLYQNHSWSFNNFTTFYWTSSMISSTRTIARGINIVDPSVSRYKSLQVNSFSVRCIKIQSRKL